MKTIAFFPLFYTYVTYLKFFNRLAHYILENSCCYQTQRCVNPALISLQIKSVITHPP